MAATFACQSYVSDAGQVRRAVEMNLRLTGARYVPKQLICLWHAAYPPNPCGDSKIDHVAALNLRFSQPLYGYQSTYRCPLLPPCPLRLP